LSTELGDRQQSARTVTPPARAGAKTVACPSTTPAPKIWSLIVGYAVIGTMNPVSVRAQANKWPVVQPLRERRTFVSPGRDTADTPFLAFIKDSKDVPIYKLECHNGNYENESEINFSGDFHCALFAVKGDTLKSGDLLAANTRNERSTDWWNRGRMFSDQLRGECLAYPEYSTIRHFKLRGHRMERQQGPAEQSPLGEVYVYPRCWSRQDGS
jgi:hypothetical protein